ncbi:MAG TPA: electron transfer flavoprotein subunit alpha/FixB family protein [Vicinamibacterales bacterium]|nr:electron transfer flavoprotein subunit alpha/FixB family protein [Vicinamibacterales bacterium]
MILIIAEQRDGKLNRATLEAIAAAQTLAGDAPIKAAVLGQSVAAVAQDLSTAVSEVLLVEHAALGTYTPDAFTAAVQQIVASAKPDYVLLPHTYQTRDFAPMAAVRMGASLITDVVGINGTGATATFVRPMFQGKLAAEVRPQGDGPRCVTIQIGAFRADAVKRGDAAKVTPASVDIAPSAIRQSPEAPFKEAKQAVDLGQAERIVAVGRGIKSQENVAVAERLAKAMSAEIAASRPICDNGWLPMDRQIGSSGQTVAPKLYVALGISGAIQHLVGMKGARTIVAINKDADAPIFEIADYGIVGDLFEIVPALVSELEKS